MNRTELEITLSRDRAWLLETLAGFPEEKRNKAVTPSQHDPSTMWTYQDHFIHLALIEFNFNAMVRRFIAGNANPVKIGGRSIGDADRSRDQLMADVHAMTEEWKQKHQDATWDEVVAVGQKARGETLTLISELTDEQLQMVIPGAPWADGTVGGVLGANAMHGRMHFKWAKDGEAELEAQPAATA